MTTPHLLPVTAANTPAASASLLQAVQGQLGMVPNMMASMAHAPSVLRGYLGLADALAHGSLSARERESIALAVGEANQCGYCVAAHSALGAGAGLAPADIAAARRARATSPREAALLALAAAVIDTRGHLTAAHWAAARSAGLDPATVLEVIASSVLNVLTNYVNHAVGTEIDFPPAPALA